jgi:hypothetical protein
MVRHMWGNRGDVRQDGFRTHTMSRASDCQSLPSGTTRRIYVVSIDRNVAWFALQRPTQAEVISEELLESEGRHGGAPGTPQS